MDIGTIIGLAGAFGVVAFGILMGGSAAIFIDIPSMFITFGGAFGATLLHYPLPKIMATLGVVRKAFTGRADDYVKLFNLMTDLGLRARRDGILALENDIDNFTDEFMKKGFQMAVDGNSADVIRHVLEEDVAAMQRRHITGQGVFKGLANYAPAFGMIGTLVGLVQMLQNMSDPTSIGAGMATALITTFYGSLIANTFALPIAGKLEQRTEEEVAMKNMIMEGILSIQEGNSPRVIRDKLRAYIPPNIRRKLQDDKDKK